MTEKKHYIDSVKVESESRRILKPLLRRYSDEGRYVLTDKGRLSKHMQEKFGDVLVQKNGEAVWVELKAEKDFTGNFFIEEWSNRHWGNPGWLYKLDADLLFYHFIGDGLLYIINFQELREWLLEKQPDWCNYKSRRINLTQYEERRQGKYTQKNDTWGRVIPIGEISKTPHVTMGMQRLYGERRAA